MNPKIASSIAARFWVKIKANLIGSGEETCQNDRTAKQLPNR